MPIPRWRSDLELLAASMPYPVSATLRKAFTACASTTATDEAVARPRARRVCTQAQWDRPHPPHRGSSRSSPRITSLTDPYVSH